MNELLFFQYLPTHKAVSCKLSHISNQISIFDAIACREFGNFLSEKYFLVINNFRFPTIADDSAYSSVDFRLFPRISVDFWVQVKIGK